VQPLAPAGHLVHWAVPSGGRPYPSYRQFMRQFFQFFAKYLIISGLLSGCAIPITSRSHYGLDIFYQNDLPNQPFDELGLVEVEDQQKNLPDASQPNGRTMRGLDSRAKDQLLARLVAKAKAGVNADGLIQVDYKLTLSRDVAVYKISGVAIKYQARPAPR
jgi:hypothetical protein